MLNSYTIQSVTFLRILKSIHLYMLMTLFCFLDRAFSIMKTKKTNKMHKLILD